MDLKSYQSIAEHLEAEIVSGKYVAGSTLPSVRDLAAVYGVSPQTISKSIALLSDKEIVKTRRGSGSIVIYEQSIKNSRTISMLVDNERNSVLSNRENPASYHSKDIYLSYLLHMNQLSLPSQILVYENESAVCDEVLCKNLENSGAVLVQGSLPECYFRFLENKKIPVVIINREVPSYLEKGYWGAVKIGGRGVGEAINYLRSLGHYKILFPCPSYIHDESVFDERYNKAFEAAQSAFGKNPFTLEVFRFQENTQSNLGVLEAYLKDGFSASFGFNDVSALELSQLLNALGVKLPEEFSLVGFDDIFAAQLSSPPLTTIKVPRAGMVEQAFLMLDKLFAAQDRGVKVLKLYEEVESTFVIRGSSFVRK